MSKAVKRITIAGVPVDDVDMGMAITRCSELLRGDVAKSVIAVNPEKVLAAQGSTVLLERLKNSGLLVPDGVGIVAAARILGLGAFPRVPGAELMPELCRYAADHGEPVFLFGAQSEVVKRAATSLVNAFPRLNVVGAEHGFVAPGDMPELITRINNSEARLLFIALGSPRQELWMDKFLAQLTTVRVCQGVGGTFDVLSGEVKRAPLLFRKCGLEWLYRLLSQPSRIFRQTALPKFVFMVMKQFLIRSKSW